MDKQNMAQSAADDTAQAAGQPTFAVEETPAGRRLVRVGEPGEAAGPPPDDTPGDTPDKTAAATPPTEGAAQDGRPPEPGSDYTLEEIDAAEDLRALDPERIPGELKPYYQAMVRGMNAKFQDAAVKQKALDEMLALARQTNSQAGPEPREYYAQRHGFIKNEVARIFGADPAALDDSDDWTPEMRLAYQDISLKVRAYETEQAAQRQREAEIRNFTGLVEEELRAADPQAYEYALKKIESGEVLERDKLAIGKALVDGDKKRLTELFTKFRNEFRGIQKPAAPKPVPRAPALESAGKAAAGENPAPAFDDAWYGRFRAADPDAKLKMLSEYNKTMRK